MSQIILISDSSDEDFQNAPGVENGIDARQSKIGPGGNESKMAENGRIGSTDEKVVSDSENDTIYSHNTSQKTKLFEEFISLCLGHVKDDSSGTKIINFLQMKYEKASKDYKSSQQCSELLHSLILRLENGSKDVYVFINDLTSALESHTITGSEQSSINTKKQPSKRTHEVKVKHHDVNKKRRVKLVSEETNNAFSQASKMSEEKNTDGVDNTFNSVDESDVPSTSTSTVSLKSSNSHTNQSKKGKIAKKIKYLEKLLKRFSDEILKLQYRELTLEEMYEEDSCYMQEAKLKKHFMLIYKELCKINQCQLSTGRVIERKIKVTASRFPEINRKVESFINHPKQDVMIGLPDFPDIYYLVKQADIKYKLNLTKAQLKMTAQDIFHEVGESMQERRQKDFVYEFESCVADEEKNEPDPARIYPELEQKLKNNRKVARTNLDLVIEKYANLQEESFASKQNGESTLENTVPPVLKEDPLEEELSLGGTDSNNEGTVNDTAAGSSKPTQECKLVIDDDVIMIDEDPIDDT